MKEKYFIGLVVGFLVLLWAGFSLAGNQGEGCFGAGCQNNLVTEKQELKSGSCQKCSHQTSQSSAKCANCSMAKDDSGSPAGCGCGKNREGAGSCSH